MQGQWVAAPLEDLPPARASFEPRVPHLHGRFSIKKRNESRLEIAPSHFTYSPIGAFRSSIIFTVCTTVHLLKKKLNKTKGMTDVSYKDVVIPIQKITVNFCFRLPLVTVYVSYQI